MTINTDCHYKTHGISVPKMGFLDAIVFIIPLVQFLQINIVGRLYLTEILLTGMLLLLLATGRGHRLLGKAPFLIIGLLFFWLLAQIGTDLIRSTPFNDYARGWAKIGFTLINFSALYLLLYGNEKRLILFAAGAAIGDLTIYFVEPNYRAETYPWKFGYGLGITWLLVIVTVIIAKKQNLTSRLWSSIVLFGMAVLNVYMDFRSLGGVLFLTAAYLAYPILLGHKQRMRVRNNLRKLLPLGTGLLLTTWGVLQAYEYSAKNGWLGEKSFQKYEQQVSGGFGLLLGGRSEYLVSTQAILDSPVIGHGSWAKDCHYSSMLHDIKMELGYFGWKPKEECLIPSHSYLMGSWVEAGIIGAVFWLVILGLTIRILNHINIIDTRLTPLIAFTAFLLVWNILFSPFAAHARFMVPFAIVMFISYLPRNFYLEPVSGNGEHPT